MTKKKDIDYSLFLSILKPEKLGDPQFEYKFHDKRKWRFDICWPEWKLAVEIEGGIWTNGRHTRPSGFVKDMEKYNQAAIYGYRLIRVTPDQIANGDATIPIIEFIKRQYGA
jgi:hypothetical protein